MGVRAKFYVTEVCQTTYGGQVKLAPVTRGGENAEWASATPSGQIQMTIRNEVALDFFGGKTGGEFFVDFTPAPKPET